MGSIEDSVLREYLGFDLGVAILAEGGGSLSLELKPPTRRATRRF